MEPPSDSPLVKVVELTDEEGYAHSYDVEGTAAIEALSLSAAQWTAIMGYGCQLGNDKTATAPKDVLNGLDYTKIVHALLGGPTKEQDERNAAVIAQYGRNSREAEYKTIMGPRSKVVTLDVNYVMLLAACIVVGDRLGTLDLSFKGHPGRLELYRMASVRSAAMAYLSVDHIKHVGNRTDVSKVSGDRPLMIFLDGLTTEDIRDVVDGVSEVTGLSSCGKCLERTRELHKSKLRSGSHGWIGDCRVFDLGSKQACGSCFWTSNSSGCSHHKDMPGARRPRKRRRVHTEEEKEREPSAERAESVSTLSSLESLSPPPTADNTDSFPDEEVSETVETSTPGGHTPIQTTSFCETASFTAPPLAATATSIAASTPDLVMTDATEKPLTDRLEDIMDEVGEKLDGIYAKINEGNRYDYQDRKLVTKVRNSLEAVNELVKMIGSGNNIA